MHPIRPTQARLVSLMVILAVMLVGPADARSSVASQGEGTQTSYRFAYTPIYQFATDLDSGGSFDVHRHYLRFDVSRFIDPQWTVGLGLGLDYERWDFSGIDGLSGVDLWDEIFRPGISLAVFYSTASNWRFGVMPSIDFAVATGAQAGESLSYGAVLSAAYAFGPGLVLGLGAGVFERLEESEVFPLVIIDWKINDRLRLANPFSAGPVGPAGLELVYTRDAVLEMGVGGAYRSYRFRLDDSSVVADGIGEVDFWAPFIRIGWRLGEHFRLDLNGGALIGGNIAIEDENGNKRGETDYDTAPFAGLTLKGQF